MNSAIRILKWMGTILEFFIQKIFIGKPKTIVEIDEVNQKRKEWKSGIFKEEWDRPIFVGKNNLDGDGQADLKNHGGPEKAIFCYPHEHYQFFQMKEMGPGGMGENFSTVNMTEDCVAIGDTFKIGEAIIQVSQPRQPCWKPARRFQKKDLSLMIQDSGRTGWYFRVLQEGTIEKGQQLIVLDRPAAHWTIAECNELMHKRKDDLQQAAALAECEYLSVNWKNTLRKRLSGIQSDSRKRLYGTE